MAIGRLREFFILYTRESSIAFESSKFSTGQRQENIKHVEGNDRYCLNLAILSDAPASRTHNAVSS